MSSASSLSRVIDLDDTEATERLGRALAPCIPAATAIELRGDLGAGKTTLARALIQTWLPQARVKSPTYTLIEQYEAPRFPVHHLDLYRIADPEELEYLALRDADPRTVWLIEWAARGGDRLPAIDLCIALSHRGAGRRAELSAFTPLGEGVLRSLSPTI